MRILDYTKVSLSLAVIGNFSGPNPVGYDLINIIQLVCVGQGQTTAEMSVTFQFRVTCSWPKNTERREQKVMTKFR